jgi:histidyl-tRNA synthetase
MGWEMINEFAIPQGSRLYFGKNARKKREIENRCVALFYENGFEEIATPFFSYHQNLKEQKEIITFSDVSNNRVSLRADSAQDVVRLITKRLGRSVEHTKWFYVQPVFKYPTTEKHQIGAEWIGNDNIADAANLCADLLGNFEDDFALQIGNIKIPQLIADETGIPMRHFTTHNIEAISAYKIPWLDRLIEITDAEEIPGVLAQVSPAVRLELEKLFDAAKAVKNSRIIVTPVHHTDLEYYDELFFRCLCKNRLIAMGGSYRVDDARASGFAIYTDELINE